MAPGEAQVHDGDTVKLLGGLGVQFGLETHVLSMGLVIEYAEGEGLALAVWRCSGATQTEDDHPTEIDFVHPTLTPLCSKDARLVKKDLTEGRRPPLVDTLDYEPTPPEPEAVSSGSACPIICRHSLKWQ